METNDNPSKLCNAPPLEATTEITVGRKSKLLLLFRIGSSTGLTFITRRI